MFYRVDSLEEMIKMSNNKSVIRDSRFTKLDPYKWMNSQGKSDDKDIDSNKLGTR